MKKNIKQIMNQEYLMTNGLGGYTFGTLDQVNCRKYHSLYTVSYEPPVKRMHLISKMTETILMDGKMIPFTFENHTGSDQTESYLKSYDHVGYIGQSFETQGISMNRTHAMAYGTHLLVVDYEIHMPLSGEFKLTPLFNFRDHHDTAMPELIKYKSTVDAENHIVKVNTDEFELYIQSDGIYQSDLKYSEISYYPIETQRGYPDQEPHVILGHFVYPLHVGLNKITVAVNIKPDFKGFENVIRDRHNRYLSLIQKAQFKNDQINRLIQAADDFIVYRKNTGKKSIIAGYPWFTDWGRDTMIALPGLTLSTHRFDEGLEMIETFLEKSHQGIIPNNFPDEGEAPMYNTSDGTLWLFTALYHYYEKTKDLKAIKRLYPKLVEILKYHVEGTINDIFMDTDGLLSTGNETTQLTWMDVKVNGWVVTPRHGKAVEINALWYNALAVTDYFAQLMGIKMQYSDWIPKVKTAFNHSFWNEAEKNLYDLIIDDVQMNIPRPNMIFSISLPFPVLDQKHWNAVTDYVTTNFKTPYGLLTLKRDDPDFHPHYEGDLLSRDGAYHRGTAWGWLIGPYLEAHFKTYHDKAFIHTALKAFFTHLDEGILGSASEIFEGTPPHEQRGCSAQAWSVAEVIRIWELCGLDENE